MAVYCFTCRKVFTKQSNFNRHNRNVHGIAGKQIIQYDKDVSLYKCLEGCEVSFHSHMDLRLHLKHKHEMNFECEERSFSSFDEFTSWIAATEKDGNVKYERMTGCKRQKGQDVERIYFECIRSGKIPQHCTSRKRCMKSQGSRKINMFCTSQIILIRDINTEECSMQFYKTHYGHAQDLQHLPLPNVDRVNVAEKLVAGVTPTEILDSVRDDINNQLKRTGLMTRKDINNIKRAFNINIKDGCRGSEDTTNVELWVRECSVSEKNTVLFYKRQE